MSKLMNISDGPRGLRLKSGVVMVEAGEIVDASDLAEGETPNEEWFAGARSAAAKEAIAEGEGLDSSVAHADAGKGAAKPATK